MGGVETAQDVQARLDAGATLVQGYTAFLYEGPFWAARINRQLAKHRAPPLTPLQATTKPPAAWLPGASSSAETLRAGMIRRGTLRA